MKTLKPLFLLLLLALPACAARLDQYPNQYDTGTVRGLGILPATNSAGFETVLTPPAFNLQITNGIYATGTGAGAAFTNSPFYWVERLAWETNLVTIITNDYVILNVTNISDPAVLAYFAPIVNFQHLPGVSAVYSGPDYFLTNFYQSPSHIICQTYMDVAGEYIAGSWNLYAAETNDVGTNYASVGYLSQAWFSVGTELDGYWENGDNGSKPFYWSVNTNIVSTTNTTALRGGWWNAQGQAVLPLAASSFAVYPASTPLEWPTSNGWSFLTTGGIGGTWTDNGGGGTFAAANIVTTNVYFPGLVTFEQAYYTISPDNVFGAKSTAAVIISNTVFSIKLPPGIYEFTAALHGQTTSETSGIQCRIITDPPATAYGAGMRAVSAYGNPIAYALTTAQTGILIECLSDAPGNYCIGHSTGYLKLTQETIIYPVIFQRTAVDTNNAPFLTPNTFLKFNRIR